MIHRQSLENMSIVFKLKESLDLREEREGGSFFSPSFSVSCHLLPNYRICVKIPLLSNQFGMRPIIVARIPNNFYPTAFSRAKNRQIFLLIFCCKEICIRWGTTDQLKGNGKANILTGLYNGAKKKFTVYITARKYDDMRPACAIIFHGKMAHPIYCP